MSNNKRVIEPAQHGLSANGHPSADTTCLNGEDLLHKNLDQGIGQASESGNGCLEAENPDRRNHFLSKMLIFCPSN